MTTQPYNFYIDILGSCNLRCPSCPVGNFDSQNPKGFMAPEMLDKILKKASSECKINAVCLYNWTEPLLHPKFTEMIEIVKSYGAMCYVSSNLNILKNPEVVLAANPHWFRISVSGFNQGTYSVTHRGGDIEKVKQNMIALAEAKKSTGSTTRIHVFFHRYLGNLDEEIQMKKFTEELGFDFETGWAFMMPLEKVLAYVTDDQSEVKLTDDDYSIIDRLPLNLKQASEVAQKYKDKPCELLGEYITMNYLGDVQLCCAVYDSTKFTVTNYLDMPLDEIQKLRGNNSYCGKCTDKGLHVYATYGAPEFDEIAQKNVAEYYSQSGWPFAAQIDAKVELNEKIKELEDEVASLKQSTSWKITSPLRKTVEFVRGSTN